MATGVKSDTSKRLGALLLKGWAMLAENCPDCRVPLMKERGTEERLCVNCDTTYIPDGQGLRPLTPENEQSASQEQQQAQQQQQQTAQPTNRMLQTEADGYVGASESSSTGDDHDPPYDPLSDSRLGPFAAAPASAGGAKEVDRGGAASDLTAATGSHLPNGPPQQESAAAPATVAAGREKGPGADGNSCPGRLPAPAVSTADGAASSAPSNDDVAERLSTKMLQGWALLDKCCPRCATVLVRSKITKRMFCVACDGWVLTEAEVNQQQQQQQQQQQAQATGAQTQPLQPSTSAARGSAQRADDQPQSEIPQRTQHQAHQLPGLTSPRADSGEAPGEALKAAREPRERNSGGRASPPVASADGAVSPSRQELVSPGVSPPPLAAPLAATPGLPPFLADWVQQQQQLRSPQLPALYQHFFQQSPVRGAAGGVRGGTPDLSRGASPPQQLGPGYPYLVVPDAPLQLQQGFVKADPGAQQPQSQQPQQQTATAQPAPLQPQSQLQQSQQQQQPRSSRHPSTSGVLGGQAGSGGAGGSAGAGKQPGASQLLLSLGRTVALKMSEAQGLLERTSALDTEKARAYVSFISECLDLLAKLHALQT